MFDCCGRNFTCFGESGQSLLVVVGAAADDEVPTLQSLYF